MLTHMQIEVMQVLRVHPHTFIYFCDPITQENGKIRDYAVGIYNYVLNVHIFMLTNELSATNSKAYATLGPHDRNHWHRMPEDNLEFFQLYHAQLKSARNLFQEFQASEMGNEERS